MENVENFLLGENLSVGIDTERIADFKREYECAFTGESDTQTPSLPWADVAWTGVQEIMSKHHGE